MSEKKPLPLTLQRPVAQKKCPVCGHSSYSIDGTHPQCHGALADKIRLARRAAEARENPPQAQAGLKKAGFNGAVRLAV